MPRARGRAPANPFWAYSLRLYRRPGVAAACIGLQDRLGVDVNVLLFCLWAAACGRTLSPAALKLAVGLSRVWTANVVAPLRGTRRFLKPLALPRLRADVARVELAAERVEQDFLRRLVPHVGRAAAGTRHGGDRALTNLVRYAQHWARPPRAADVDDLRRIIGVAFPDADLNGVRQRFR